MSTFPWSSIIVPPNLNISNNPIADTENVFIGGIENGQGFFKYLHQTPGQYLVNAESPTGELILEEYKINNT